MADRPLLGEFRSKPSNAPRGSMLSPEQLEELPKPPVTETVPAKESAEETPEEKFDVPEELTPAERYRKRLESAKIDLAHASAIYDAILDKGYYEEYVRIRKNRAVFRTRSYEDQLRLQTALEAVTPRMMISQEELVSRYNLASSLFEWNGKSLRHDTDEDFDSIMAMIKKMPAPLVGLLYDHLAKFDQKVMLVFSEGATDSF